MVDDVAGGALAASSPSVGVSHSVVTVTNKSIHLQQQKSEAAERKL